MPSAVELRELEDEELETRLGEYRRELLNLRFQLATGQLDNTARLSQVKKDVARVLAILRDREIALAEGRPAGPVVLDTPPRPPKPPRPSRSRRKAEDEEALIEDDVVDESDGAPDDAAEADEEEA